VNVRTTMLALAAATAATGCSFIANLTSAGGADPSAFTVDMERYEVKRISLAQQGGKDTICPSSKVTFTVLADAIDIKKSSEMTLETADPKGKAGDARGKMDLTEFALAARGGTIEEGVFSSTSDPFAALLGFDVKATYRLDKTKEATRHFAPEYSCIGAIGGSGPSGSSGRGGASGSSNGGAGGAGGSGSPGGPGPRVTAHVSIVETPLFDRVGIVRVGGDMAGLTLFDLSAGITVSARGGSGGSGGQGGRGGTGAQPQGRGGPGGPGGDGAPGGDGGQVLLVLDDRYPELAESVRVDVSGGMGGSGGSGGYGGSGAPAYTPCSGCKMIPAGQQGPGGPSGMDSNSSGRPGVAEIRREDVTAVFAELPPGVRLRADARPEPVMAPPPPPTGKKKKGKPV
jgi:hypothetical protein